MKKSRYFKWNNEKVTEGYKMEKLRKKLK